MNTDTTKPEGKKKNKAKGAWADVADASAQNEAEQKRLHEPHAAREYIDRILVKLSREEMAARGETLAHIYSDIAEYEQAKKSDSDAWKAKIEAKQGEADRVAGILRTGKEPRETEMLERKLFETATVEVRVKATGELYETRCMTSLERQRGLFDLAGTFEGEPSLPGEGREGGTPAYRIPPGEMDPIPVVSDGDVLTPKKNKKEGTK